MFVSLSSIGSSLGILDLRANGLIERSSSVSARGASRPFEASPLVVRAFILGGTSNVSAFVDSKTVYSL